MRKLLLKIHLYSGLICFWYLIILGISSLNFNHRFAFMESGNAVETWSEEISVPRNFSDDRYLSESIRDSLSLIGWPLPWETWHDSTGVFHFALQHPGKRYIVDYDFKNRVAYVQEARRGFWGVFNSLHGIGSVPNSWFMDCWKWYTCITTALVIFSVIAGIYLWYRSNRDKRTGLYVILFSAIVSIGWMFQLYYHG